MYLRWHSQHPSYDILHINVSVDQLSIDCSVSGWKWVTKHTSLIKLLKRERWSTSGHLCVSVSQRAVVRGEPELKDRRATSRNDTRRQCKNELQKEYCVKIKLIALV